MIIRLIKNGTVYTGDKEGEELERITDKTDKTIAKNKSRIKGELGPLFKKKDKVYRSQLINHLRHLKDINAISSVKDFYAILEGKTPEHKTEEDGIEYEPRTFWQKIWGVKARPKNTSKENEDSKYDEVKNS